MSADISARWPRSVLALGLLLAAGCAGEPKPDDSEPTGASDTDTDGDGLTDAEEAELGTDPEATDTDGDGYLDPWEVAEGTDPADADDRIYIGGWPYNPDKDALEDPGFEDAWTVGARIPRFTAVDQFGQQVDLYDFAGHDRAIAVELAAVWCPNCKAVSKWVAGLTDWPFSAYGESYAELPDAVANGDILWITLLLEDVSAGGAVSAEDVATWDERYSDGSIPVLADESGQVFSTLHTDVFPNVMVLKSDLTIAVFDPSDWGVGLTGAVGWL